MGKKGNKVLPTAEGHLTNTEGTMEIGPQRLTASQWHCRGQESAGTLRP